MTSQSGGGGLAVGAFTGYALIQDQETSGTDGGGGTSGSFATRVLNTIVANPSGFAALASNQVTLPAGTYAVRANAPCFITGRHQLRLQNITLGTTIQFGQTAYAVTTTNAETSAHLTAYFTLATITVLELQHRIETTGTVNRMGLAMGWGTEVYAQLEIWRQ